ncbi:hypothetical protein GGI04_002402 [Coemansia thaxteri]|uniref:Uncharacterized protein n=1 Tax=Coemansia thaxteri TaxID=2663907 RepID=A0A9W8EHZ3_9FUNG|nr:hypothetical protein H4R26_003036 [Coemansia thaxteri]KAJ2005017.1 hypothetical protein GGI04_002402 [Coemansia thaxteri]KAJ2471689.1 hypothetical protein GGI02_002098 [Coemansia sp. RSA 2322]KAJ2484479.1 hypothetical protein EV174_002403 [Coemansia sp. RSA 2320]
MGDELTAATYRKETWPRRRNPLPASMLYGTSPRRRKEEASASPALSAGSVVGSPVFAAASGGFWDGDTASSGDEITLSMQIKQQQRTIGELTRQLEERERELARHMRAADELRASADVARRQAQASRHAAAQREQQVRWHEEQLLAHSEEARQAAAAHQAALRVADRRHQAAVDRLLAEVARAEDESKGLAVRIEELARRLDRARAMEEQSSSANEQLERQVLDARQAAAHAAHASAELAACLAERSAYIDRLERQARVLLPPASPCPQPAVATPAAPGLRAAGSAGSLHAEIAKASQQQQQQRQQMQTACVLAPLQPLSRMPPYRDLPSSVHEPRGPEGLLVWLAVCVHMVWALYLRLCLHPLAVFAGAAIGAALRVLASRPWLRPLLLYLAPSTASYESKSRQRTSQYAS